jgi:spoIIIJ-associated protein
MSNSNPEASSEARTEASTGASTGASTQTLQADDVEHGAMSDLASDGSADVALDPGAATDREDDVQPTDESAGSAGPTASAADAGKSSRLRQLEREGEVAADFLETLLDIADLDGDIDVDVDGDRAAIAIVDSEEGRVPRRLVGQEGRVLEALQELTRLAVQAETGERSRLMLDVGGHRAERRATLVSLANAAIAEVRESGEQKALEPMSAFERKVVHDVVAAAGLVSESEGVDPSRHITILPA